MPAVPTQLQHPCYLKHEVDECVYLTIFPFLQLYKDLAKLELKTLKLAKEKKDKNEEKRV